MSTSVIPFTEVVSHVLSILYGHTGINFTNGDGQSSQFSEPHSDNPKIATGLWQSDPFNIHGGPVGFIADTTIVSISTPIIVIDEPLSYDNALIEIPESGKYTIPVVQTFQRNGSNIMTAARRLAFRNSFFSHFDD